MTYPQTGPISSQQRAPQSLHMGTLGISLHPSPNITYQSCLFVSPCIFFTWSLWKKLFFFFFFSSFTIESRYAFLLVSGQSLIGVMASDEQLFWDVWSSLKSAMWMKPLKVWNYLAFFCPLVLQTVLQSEDAYLTYICPYRWMGSRANLQEAWSRKLLGEAIACKC